MAIVKRIEKGSELTHLELDGNFTDLDTRVSSLEASDANDISLTSLSVTSNPVGVAALSYDNATGVFTYTPPDLSSVSGTTAETIEFTVHNDSGGVLTKGEVVYISGLNGNTPEVSKAQANSSTTMPAFGIVKADIANTADGTVITFGSCPGHDAANFGETGITFALGDTLYVSATEAGKLTNVAPAGESNLIQNIGKIERATPTTNMTIKVGGAGRTNATPNLNNGNIFIGNAQNQSSTASFNSTVDAHLNTGTAGSGEVLSWTGTDYDWVAQSGGGPETDPVVGAVTGIVKADGAGNISAAVAGTDYLTTVAFADLTGKPTTLAGYGITDALTSGGALIGTGLEAEAVGAGVADGNDLAISGGDAVEVNSIGGDANITGGSGALQPGNVNIGTTQTTLVTIGSGSNNVDFPSGTAVDFSGATVTGLTVTETDPVVGAITGIVKADGAGNISAAVAGTDYSTFDGAFGSLSGTPTTLGGYGITDAVDPNTETTFTKDVHFDRGVEEKFQTLTGQSGVVAHNWNDGHIFYHTTPAGDITANFTNVNLTAEYATNVTIIINQGATPYIVTAVQIAGSGQTINWQGGSAPTGNANGIDSFSFTILNDGGSYVVLGQMVDFT